MSLPDRLTQELQLAMKSKDQLRMDVIRMIKAAFQKREIELKKDLDDMEMSRIMTTLIKQRRESIDMYEKGQRADLAGRERQEITIIESYLPKPPSADELAALVDRIIQQAGSPTIKDMGTIMKATMAQLGGRPVDGKVVSDLVRSKLA
ncbi:aspartyl-tRNA amidotransferase subunit B [Nitrospira sp.]|nr:aspartyl-tRNA amidotransferase subunit B [Nitrospira sp.]